jgi:4-oxalmesaconate hydratase
MTASWKPGLAWESARSLWAAIADWPRILRSRRSTSFLLKNIFFDTVVYRQPGIETLFKVIPISNILFASEMLGAVRGIDPETSHSYDDTKRSVDAFLVSDEDRRKVFSDNARRVYRLDRSSYFKQMR